MTQHDEDPLDDLKDEWRDVMPPDRSADLADADPATRATVDWLKSAWRSSAVPAPAPRIVRPVRRPVHWRHVAAAAAVVFASAALTFLATRGREVVDRAPTPTMAAHPDADVRAAAFAAVAATRAALTNPASFPGLVVADCSTAHAPVERLSCAFHATRAGDYSDSIRYASPVADDPTASTADRCAALTHIVVAEYGLGRSDEAARQEERLVAALR